MDANPSRLNARGYIESLASRGRYQFGSEEARKALGVSEAAAKLALNRLARRGLIASPARGFYVIVLPEYHRLGCLPAEQFIPSLMQRQGLDYYAGLLSAAQFYGAAHQRPQEFQVMLAKARRPIHCGQIRVVFHVRKRLKDVPVQTLNTPRGTILVSAPEATALDLVGYQEQVGGLDVVATVLAELAEKIDPEKLATVAQTAPLPWAQRLGYLLQKVGFAEKTTALKDYVRRHARQSAALLPGAPVKDAPHRVARKGNAVVIRAKCKHLAKNAQRDVAWKVIVNADVEAEL